MTITFNEVGKTEVEVKKDSQAYGTLKFDAEQNAWVLWLVSNGDKVTYTSDLTSTKEKITTEINEYDDDDDEDYDQYDD